MALVGQAAGSTPLVNAFNNRSSKAAVAAIQALLAAGADVQAVGEDRITALHRAALKISHPARAAAVVRALVAAGAVLNAATTAGHRPLHYATHHTETALLLVRLGASLSAVDGQGRTALQAAAGGRAEVEAALRHASSHERQCAGCGSTVGERIKRCSGCWGASYCRCVDGGWEGWRGA